mmetsp:Transcript_34929/g.87901  ORF Transcript_34929/g.87901 Transcript_34929/m.87901 type:complete len:293 (+) Transcript_34929:467-1345(+)
MNVDLVDGSLQSDGTSGGRRGKRCTRVPVVPHLCREVASHRGGPLVEHRGEEQSTAQHELTIHIVGVRILGKLKEERSHHRLAQRGGVEEERIVVGYKRIAGGQNLPRDRRHLIGSVELLVRRAESGVVTRERIKRTDFDPTRAQLDSGVIEETTDIGTNHRDTKELKVQHLYNGPIEIGPLRGVITGPVESMVSRTDERRASQDERALVGDLLQGRHGRLGLEQGVQVVRIILDDTTIVLVVHVERLHVQRILVAAVVDGIRRIGVVGHSSVAKTTARNRRGMTARQCVAF